MRSSGLLGVSTQTMRGPLRGDRRGGVGSPQRSAKTSVEVLLRGERAQQPLRAAVTVVRRDDRVAGVRSCSTSVTADIPVFVTTPRDAALELGQRVGEMRAGRIPAARVVVLARLAEALEGKRRREVERRHDGAVFAVGGDAGADGARRWAAVFEGAHETSVVAIATSRMLPRASGSVRKASWPRPSR